MGDIGPYRAHYDVLPADDLEIPLPLVDDQSDEPLDGAFARGSGPDPDEADR